MPSTGAVTGGAGALVAGLFGLLYKSGFGQPGFEELPTLDTVRALDLGSPDEGAGHEGGWGLDKIFAAAVVCDVLLLLLGPWAWFLFCRKPSSPEPDADHASQTGSLTFRIIKVTNLPNTKLRAKKVAPNSHHGCLTPLIKPCGGAEPKDKVRATKEVTDSYVEVKVRGDSKHTPTIRSNLNPQWDAKHGTLGPFDVDLDDTKYTEPSVILTVKDGGHQPLGDLRYDAKHLVSKVSASWWTYHVTESLGNVKGGGATKIEMEVSWVLHPPR